MFIKILINRLNKVLSSWIYTKDYWIIGKGQNGVKNKNINKKLTPPIAQIFFPDINKQWLFIL